MTAGAAAVVAASVLRPRKDYGRRAILPHNVPFVLLGAGLLWFGWFGFNGGSALAANPTAVLAFVNTLLAPAATLTIWLVLDLVRSRRATAVGAATGVVVGLVAITPAAGFVGPVAALAIGAIAAFPSYFAILLRVRTGRDDSLDVAAAHGVRGVVGVLAAAIWSAAATWGLLRIVGAAARLRSAPRDEGVGLDVMEHGKEAYLKGDGAVLVAPGDERGGA